MSAIDAADPPEAVVATHPGGAAGGQERADHPVICAIDIGTNSVHSVVARFVAGDRFEVLDREKEMVRLGSGGSDMKTLADDAIERGIAALRRAQRLAARHGAHVEAVATSATREAENRDEFVRRAREEAGVEVEVISGYEEARLIHLGVLQALPVYETPLLLCDIGGGSTELLLGHRDQVRAARSVKVGSLRLTRRFFRGDRLHPAAVDSCRRYVRAMVDDMARAAERVGFEVAIGSSGTVQNLALMCFMRRGGEPPQNLNGARFTRKALTKVVGDLAAAPTVEERRQLPGLDPARADIILAGAVILEQVMDRFGIEEMAVSEYALREGVLLDALQRLRGSASHHLHDLRRQSVLHLMEACDDDPPHSHHVSRLALDLFDELRGELGLDDDHRELLEAAALLCNVGLFISHSKHHKHSYYVIRNAEQLAGFTDHEIELIALVARYHRKSAPKPKHPEFERLTPDDQRTVNHLAAVLRVAIGLDRTHAQLVKGVEVQPGPNGVRITALSTPDTDLTLELYSATERRYLLEEVVGRPVTVDARQS